MARQRRRATTGCGDLEQNDLCPGVTSLDGRTRTRSPEADECVPPRVDPARHGDLLDGLRHAVTNPRDGADRVRTRAKMRDLAQMLEGVAFGCHRVGVRIFNPPCGNIFKPVNTSPCDYWKRSGKDLAWLRIV